MQRFTLLHDGSNQGWQAVYLAFHIAAQLGAPLLVLLTEPTTDKNNPIQRAAQVEMGGRAAGVVIETRSVEGFSPSIVAENAGTSDGFFVPHTLIPDGETALRYLEVLSCPIWVVSQEAKTHNLGVLISGRAVDEKLISYGTALSRRLQQPLTGFILEESPSTFQRENDLTWIQLPNFSLNEIDHTLESYSIDILFIPASNASLVEILTSNCVLFPAKE